MFPVPAFKLNVGPVIPGTAAWAAAPRSRATIGAATRRAIENDLFMYVAPIAPLLIAGVAERVAAGHAVANVNLGHHAAEVLCVVRQFVEIWRVHVERAARRIQRCGAACAAATGVAGIQDHVKRLAAPQRDG